MQENQINFKFLLKKTKQNMTMGLVGRTVKGQERSLSLVSTGRWQRDCYSSAVSTLAHCIDLLCAAMGIGWRAFFHNYSCLIL